MTMIRTLLAIMAALIAMPASADTTAHYKSPEGGRMTIELVGNGDMRTTMGAGSTTMLMVKGVDYMIFYDEGGPVVVRMRDVATVMLDHVRKRIPALLDLEESDAPFPMKYLQGGQMTVGARAGIIWYLSFDEDRLEPRRKIVMSADP